MERPAFIVGWEATGNAGGLAGEKRAMDSIMGRGGAALWSLPPLCASHLRPASLGQKAVLETLASASQLEGSDEVKSKRKDIRKCQRGHYGVCTRG